MTARFAVLLVAMAMCTSAFAGGGDMKSPLESLVDAERAFARMATETNTREAFLANMADDAIVFNPTATEWKPWVSSHEKWGLAGLLTWDPSFAYVSAAGDLGYTTGPAQVRRERSLDAKPVYYGYFTSVWQNRDGVWKNIVDIGTGTPEPGAEVPPFDASKAPHTMEAATAVDAKAARTALLEHDAWFAREVMEHGTAKAYEQALADDARMNRDEHFPMLGKKAILAELGSKRPSPVYKQAGGGIARSGDLGYAYGSFERPGGGAGNFVRIWRKDSSGAWRLALDVENDVPPPPKQ